MQDNEKKPALRFKGFTDPWEQRKLGDISEIKTGPFGSTLHADDYVSDGIPIITTEHFKTGSLPIDKCGLPQVSENDFSRLSAYILNAGDIVFSRVGSVDINALITPFQSTWLFSGRVLRVRPQNKNSSQFLHTLLETEDVKNDIRTRAVGQTMPSINTEILKTTPLRLPESTLEQEQLGKYFLNLDTLITLHQRKYDKLTKVKKAMLEKMFPENGSPYPEIRFKGFTDAWEQRKLGDTVQITMGQSPDGSTYSDVPSDYILVQGNADLQNGWVSPRVWTSQMTKKADAGDLIMSVRAPAGAMGKTAYNAVIGRGVAAIKGNEFIYQLLEKMDSDGYWKALSCGSTFESLNSDNIKNADVLIPDVAEQEKIGEYFLAIDRLITLHQRKLEKLKNIKKACLEKMFV